MGALLEGKLSGVARADAIFETIKETLTAHHAISRVTATRTTGSRTPARPAEPTLNSDALPAWVSDSAIALFSSHGASERGCGAPRGA